MSAARRVPGVLRPVALVAAMGRNRVIGRGGDLPWRLRSDLQRFKALTLGHPIVMGRKTYDSIGRPLPGRLTVVVTRGGAAPVEGVRTASALEDALRLADNAAAGMGADTIFVVGGGEIYAAALPFASRLHLTLVDAEPPGDALFPAFDAADWHETSRETRPAGPQDDHAVAFVDLVRRGSQGPGRPGRPAGDAPSQGPPAR